MQEILNGENEWTASTKQQVTRLTKLINNLVSLARMQKEQPALTMVPVNVSQIAGDVASSFKSVISTEQKQFNVQIDEGLVANADENMLRELLNILLDNANKYCDPQGKLILQWPHLIIARISLRLRTAIRMVKAWMLKILLTAFTGLMNRILKEKRLALGLGFRCLNILLNNLKEKLRQNIPMVN